jgi:serine/threonine protein kinase
MDPDQTVRMFLCWFCHDTAHLFFQITEALSYLHGTEQMIHRNVCPQSVLVTKTGSWKLAGLGFAEVVANGKVSDCSSTIKGQMKIKPNNGYNSVLHGARAPAEKYTG